MIVGQIYPRVSKQVIYVISVTADRSTKMKEDDSVETQRILDCMMHDGMMTKALLSSVLSFLHVTRLHIG